MCAGLKRYSNARAISILKPGYARPVLGFDNIYIVPRCPGEIYMPRSSGTRTHIHTDTHTRTRTHAHI